MDPADFSRLGRFDFVLHFHRFEHQNRLPRLDILPFPGDDLDNSTGQGDLDVLLFRLALLLFQDLEGRPLLNPEQPAIDIDGVREGVGADDDVVDFAVYFQKELIPGDEFYRNVENPAAKSDAKNVLFFLQG